MAAEAFDFLVSDDFRQALESDYSELQSCAKAGAWKAVLVLAGSIVEALLVDALLAADYQRKKGKDPLKVELAELVSICKAERILTDRAADLCSVVRSYRNLIHPGRAIRLQDAADQNAAGIAQSLIPLIAGEVAALRRKTYGLTAKQLLAKVQQDPSAQVILGHLVADLNEAERERFVLDVLPTCYLEDHANTAAASDDVFDNFDDWQRLDYLSSAYRAVLGGASDDLKRRAAQKYVTVLREAGEREVRAFDYGLFRCGDMAHLEPAQVAMVKSHILGRLKREAPYPVLEQLEGIGPFLEKADVKDWLDPLLAIITSDSVADPTRRRFIGYVALECTSVKGEVKTAVIERLRAWHARYEERGNAHAGDVKALSDNLSGEAPA